jgi:hypothetical protein
MQAAAGSGTGTSQRAAAAGARRARGPGAWALITLLMRSVWAWRGVGASRTEAKGVGPACLPLSAGGDMVAAARASHLAREGAWRERCLRSHEARRGTVRCLV